MTPRATNAVAVSKAIVQLQQLFICIMASRKPAAALHSTFAAAMISYLPTNCALVVHRPCSRQRMQRVTLHTIRLLQQ